jgi:hypothetical protein
MLRLSDIEEVMSIGAGVVSDVVLVTRSIEVVEVGGSFDSRVVESSTDRKRDLLVVFGAHTHSAVLHLPRESVRVTDILKLDLPVDLRTMFAIHNRKIGANDHSISSRGASIDVYRSLAQCHSMRDGVNRALDLRSSQTPEVA